MTFLRRTNRKLAALACSALLSVGAGYASTETVEAVALNTESVTALIQEAARLIQEQGLTIDGTEAKDAAVEALLKVADPHGQVLTDADLETLQKAQDGFAYGVDLDFIITNGWTQVEEVKSTAAGIGELGKGDIIEAIDGESTLGLQRVQVLNLLRNKEQVDVKLRVRPKEGKVRTVQVKRMPEQLKAVEVSEQWPVDLCYVRVNGLYEGSGKELVTLVREWSEKENYGGVVDLRGAGGRDIQSAIDLAGVFAKAGSELASFIGAADEAVEEFTAEGAGPIGMPVMILVDENTRGAAEVLAAIFQNSVEGAMLIGRETSGDLMLREKVSLSTGKLMLLASRALKTANGLIFNGAVGLEPDIFISTNVAQTQDVPALPSLLNSRRISTEQEEDNRHLRERVKKDVGLERAVDVLLGLKALNIRPVGSAENSKGPKGSS